MFPPNTLHELKKIKWNSRWIKLSFENFRFFFRGPFLFFIKIICKRFIYITCSAKRKKQISTAFFLIDDDSQLSWFHQHTHVVVVIFFPHNESNFFSYFLLICCGSTLIGTDCNTDLSHCIGLGRDPSRVERRQASGQGKAKACDDKAPHAGARTHVLQLTSAHRLWKRKMGGVIGVPPISPKSVCNFGLCEVSVCCGQYCPKKMILYWQMEESKAGQKNFYYSKKKRNPSSSVKT